MEIKYYIIDDKRLFIGLDYKAYEYTSNGWVERDYNEIGDRLNGYDPYEDDISHAFGNTDIMDEIRSLSKEEVIKRFGSSSIDNFEKYLSNKNNDKSKNNVCVSNGNDIMYGGYKVFSEYDKYLVKNKDQYDYFFHVDDECLLRRKKGDKKYYEHSIGEYGKYIFNQWIPKENAELSELSLITDFNQVIEMVNDFYNYVVDYHSNDYDNDEESFNDFSMNKSNALQLIALQGGSTEGLSEKEKEFVEYIRKLNREFADKGIDVAWDLPID